MPQNKKPAKREFESSLSTLAKVILRVTPDVVRAERQKREAIRAYEAHIISAMDEAREVVAARIRNGEFDGKTIEDVYADYEFEKIIRLAK